MELKLSKDIWISILSFLEPRELVHCLSVSRDFHDMLKSDKFRVKYGADFLNLYYYYYVNFNRIFNVYRKYDSNFSYKELKCKDMNRVKLIDYHYLFYDLICFTSNKSRDNAIDKIMRKNSNVILPDNYNIAYAASDIGKLCHTKFFQNQHKDFAKYWNIIYAKYCRDNPKIKMNLRYSKYTRGFKITIIYDKKPYKMQAIYRYNCETDCYENIYDPLVDYIKKSDIESFAKLSQIN